MKQVVPLRVALLEKLLNMWNKEENKMFSDLIRSGSSNLKDIEASNVKKISLCISNLSNMLLKIYFIILLNSNPPRIIASVFKRF